MYRTFAYYLNYSRKDLFEQCATVIEKYCAPAPGPFSNANMSNAMINQSLSGSLTMNCSIGYSYTYTATTTTLTSYSGSYTTSYTAYTVSARCVPFNATSGFWLTNASCTRALLIHVSCYRIFSGKSFIIAE